MKWLLDKCQGEGGHRCSLNKPANEQAVRQVERSLGIRLPEEYRRLLTLCDGGVLFYDENVESSGLHIFGCNDGLVENTEDFRRNYDTFMRDLIVFGYTPGAGAFYLAMGAQGQIVDLFGSPDETPIERSAFPRYQGEWRTIAPNLESFLKRMFDCPSNPFYWFSVP